MLNENCYAVIMAGGAGTRLWPLSTKRRPKHLLRLFDGASLIELTVDRLCGQIPRERIIVLTSANYRDLTVETLPAIPPANVICEPCVRDTASAIGLAATVLRKRCADATMIMLTADQIIEPAVGFMTAVAGAAAFLEAHPERLVAFGVEAQSPNTQVGWQKLGTAVAFDGCDVRAIAAFTEKPDLEVAQAYLDAGTYCWNSGQFAWKARTILREIREHLPAAIPLLEQIGDAWGTPLQQQTLERLFPLMPKGSIDYEVMQNTPNACSIFLPCSWEDMGTHQALVRRLGRLRGGNRAFGKAVLAGTGNEVLCNTDHCVVVARNDTLVVVTEDVVFVGDPDTDMKALVEALNCRRKKQSGGLTLHPQH